MEGAEHNSLIRQFSAAIQQPQTALTIKFKVADQVLFEVEIENLQGKQINDQVRQVVEQAIHHAATAVLVQNEIKKNGASPS